MASHEMLSRITGDPVWADRCEDLAFNSLPASLDPEGRRRSTTSPAPTASTWTTAPKPGQFQNGFAMQAYMPGVDQYRCCPHNYGMGWPYFVEELWAATPDNGLAAAMHGPCAVTAKVADGTAVTITEDTGYPFTDTITLTVDHPEGAAPSRSTCASPAGAPARDHRQRARGAAPGRARVRQDRSGPGPTATGSCCACRMQARTRTWSGNHNAVSVDFGAADLLACASARVVPDRRHRRSCRARGARHGSAWNYGLSSTGLRGHHRRAGTLPANPFTPASAPIRITAARPQIPAWKADAEHIVTPLAGQPDAAAPSRSRRSR